MFPSGAVTLQAADGGLKSLTLKPSMAGETHSSGTVTRDETGAYAVDVSGPAFNSTYFWKELSAATTRAARRRARNRPHRPQPSTPLKTA